MEITLEQSEIIIEGLTVAIDALENIALESNVKQSAIERFKRVRKHFSELVPKGED